MMFANECKKEACADASNARLYPASGKGVFSQVGGGSVEDVVRSHLGAASSGIPAASGAAGWGRACSLVAFVLGHGDVFCGRGGRPRAVQGLLWGDGAAVFMTCRGEKRVFVRRVAGRFGNTIKKAMGV